jgi:hypothetical protein
MHGDAEEAEQIPVNFIASYKKPLIYMNIIYKMEAYMNIFDTMMYLY